MSNEVDDWQYDDDEAVRFIQNYLPQELKGKFKDDDILYILDLIYEYYETNGLLGDDDDDDKEVEIDEDEVVEYVIKNIKRDHIGRFEPEEVRFIVQGEMEYCESLNMFD